MSRGLFRSVQGATRVDAVVANSAGGQIENGVRRSGIKHHHDRSRVPVDRRRNRYRSLLLMIERRPVLIPYCQRAIAHSSSSAALTASSRVGLMAVQSNRAGRHRIAKEALRPATIEVSFSSAPRSSQTPRHCVHVSISTPFLLTSFIAPWHTAQESALMDRLQSSGVRQGAWANRRANGYGQQDRRRGTRSAASLSWALRSSA
jgi:hypothetical protein